MATSIYKRLTGRARTFSGYSQLWIAPDHVLLLRSTRFHEHYWRYALSDIQAVVVTELPARTPLQAAMAAATVLWMLAATLVSSHFAKGFFLISGGLLVALVVLDIARGPRCRCFLHTAVSREPLTPVGRMRVARKMLAQLQPAIEAVQGSVASEGIEALEDRSSSQSLGGRAAELDQPPEIAQSPGHLPEVVFGLFLLNAAIIFVSLRFRFAEMMTALMFTLLAEIVLTIVALFRRGSRDFRRYIYVIMGLALLGVGWDVLQFVQSFGRWFGLVMDAAQHGRPAPMPTEVFERAHGYIAIAWRSAIGIAGLIAARVERSGTAVKAEHVP